VIAGFDIGKMSLVEWLDPVSYGAIEVYRSALEKWISFIESDPDKYNKLEKLLGLENALTSLQWSIVNTEIDYRYDTDLLKREDFWLLPSECWALKKGDCEDTTMLLGASLEIIKKSLEPKNFDYLACAGWYKQEDQYYGHAYVLFHHSRRLKWCTLETTWDSVLPIGWYVFWNPDVYVTSVAWNRSRFLDLTSREHRSLLGLTNEWYEKHRKYIELMKDYVVTGRKLDQPFMHKKRRPVPLDLSKLEVTYI